MAPFKVFYNQFSLMLKMKKYGMFTPGNPVFLLTGFGSLNRKGNTEKISSKTKLLNGDGQQTIVIICNQMPLLGVPEILEVGYQRPQCSQSSIHSVHRAG